jgi:hypothetical protein
MLRYKIGIWILIDGVHISVDVFACLIWRADMSVSLKPQLEVEFLNLFYGYICRIWKKNTLAIRLKWTTQCEWFELYVILCPHLLICFSFNFHWWRQFFIYSFACCWMMSQIAVQYYGWYLILRVERVGTDSAVIPIRKRLLTHRALMRSIVGMHIVDVPCKMVCTPETLATVLAQEHRAFFHLQP